MDGNFMKKIGAIDTKVSELEDLTKEFLGEDEEDDGEGDPAPSGSATPAGTERGDTIQEELQEDEDFYKAAEKKKDEAKHALFCPYVEEVTERANQLPRPIPLSNLSGLRWIRQYIYWTMHDETFSRASYLVFVTVMIMILTSTC